MTVSKYVILVLCCIRTVFTISDNCEKTFSTSGCEFIFNIPDMTRTPPAHILITTASWDPVNVNLTIPGFENITDVVVTRYEHADISLPVEISDIRLKRGEGKQNKTIIARSSDIVSVYVMDNEKGKGEGFLALPSSQLGTLYYVVSYVPVLSQYPTSFFCVSALDKETQVDIKTKNGHEDQVVLHAFESYRFDGDEFEDLTGTLVQSDQPIAVISGGYTNVPEDIPNVDGLVEQIPPVQHWGRNFILSPFLGINSGYVYRVISANNNTTLIISHINGTVRLLANDFYEGNITEDKMVAISSDEPVLIMQYMKGSNADPDNTRRGDPSMMLVPPLQSFSNSVTFAVLNFDFPFEYYIHVIINCSFVDGLLFDNLVSITDWNKVTTEEQSMCSIRGRVMAGVHTVTHRNPLRTFAVSVYAISTRCCTSYSYLAGTGIYYELPSLSTAIPQSNTIDKTVMPLSEHTPSTSDGGITHTSVISNKLETTFPDTSNRPAKDDDVVVVSLSIAVGLLVLLIFILIAVIVALIKRLNVKNNQPNDQSSPEASYSVNLQSVPHPLSPDGYTQYKAEENSERSYQGLYTSAVSTISTNNAYEDIPE